MISKKHGPWKELLVEINLDVKAVLVFQLIPIESQQALANSQSKK
jgi:hypothetical protein